MYACTKSCLAMSLQLVIWIDFTPSYAYVQNYAAQGNHMHQRKDLIMAACIAIVLYKFSPTCLLECSNV